MEKASLKKSDNGNKTGNSVKGIRLQGFKGFRLNRNTQILFKPVFKQTKPPVKLTDKTDSALKVVSLVSSASTSIDHSVVASSVTTLSPSTDNLKISAKHNAVGKDMKKTDDPKVPSNILLKNDNSLNNSSCTSDADNPKLASGQGFGAEKHRHRARSRSPSREKRNKLPKEQKSSRETSLRHHSPRKRRRSRSRDSHRRDRRFSRSPTDWRSEKHHRTDYRTPKKSRYSRDKSHHTRRRSSSSDLSDDKTRDRRKRRSRSPSFPNKKEQPFIDIVEDHSSKLQTSNHIAYIGDKDYKSKESKLKRSAPTSKSKGEKSTNAVVSLASIGCWLDNEEEPEEFVEEADSDSLEKKVVNSEKTGDRNVFDSLLEDETSCQDINNERIKCITEEQIKQPEIVHTDDVTNTAISTLALKSLETANIGATNDDFHITEKRINQISIGTTEAISASSIKVNDTCLAPLQTKEKSFELALTQIKENPSAAPTQMKESTHTSPMSMKEDTSVVPMQMKESSFVDKYGGNISMEENTSEVPSKEKEITFVNSVKVKNGAFLDPTKIEENNSNALVQSDEITFVSPIKVLNNTFMDPAETGKDTSITTSTKAEEVSSVVPVNVTGVSAMTSITNPSTSPTIQSANSDSTSYTIVNDIPQCKNNAEYCNTLTATYKQSEGPILIKVSEVGSTSSSIVGLSSHTVGESTEEEAKCLETNKNVLKSINTSDDKQSSLFEKFQSDFSFQTKNSDKFDFDDSKNSIDTFAMNLFSMVPNRDSTIPLSHTNSSSTVVTTSSITSMLPQTLKTSSVTNTKTIHPAKKRYHEWFKSITEQESKVKKFSQSNDDNKDCIKETSPPNLSVISSSIALKKRPIKFNLSTISLNNKQDSASESSCDLASEVLMNESNSALVKSPSNQSCDILSPETTLSECLEPPLISKAETVQTSESETPKLMMLQNAQTKVEFEASKLPTSCTFVSSSSTSFNNVNDVCQSNVDSSQKKGLTEDDSLKLLKRVLVSSEQSASKPLCQPYEHLLHNSQPSERSSYTDETAHSPESPLFCQSPIEEYTMSDDQSSLSGLEDMPPVDIRIPIDNEITEYDAEEASVTDRSLSEIPAEAMHSKQDMIPTTNSFNDVEQSHDSLIDLMADEGGEGRRRSARIKTKLDKKRRPIVSSQSFTAPTTEFDRSKMLEKATREINDVPSSTNPTFVSENLTNDNSPNKDLKPPLFELIHENIYLFEKKKSRARKEIRRMLCECNNSDDLDKPPCGDDCLNRLLMIECSARCPFGEICTNKRFQRREFVRTEVFQTSWKGWGLRAANHLPPGSLVLEYCGEVLDPLEFHRRSQLYSEDNQQHFYFMALSQDEIIDATFKGNSSRFINHSCDPNCETQKWTVNGRLRVGFFTIRDISPKEEITFDYQFERYGKEAQVCYCGSSNCRGYLGKPPDKNDNAVNDVLKLDESSIILEHENNKKIKKEKFREFKENTLENEIARLSNGLHSTKEVLLLSRLMVRSDTIKERAMCLEILQKSDSQSCLRSFLQLHGLPLIWSWMVDVSGNFSSPNNITPVDVAHLKTEILTTLSILPITNRNILDDSKVLSMVKRWLEEESAAQHSISDVTESNENAVEQSKDEDGMDKDDVKPEDSKMVEEIVECKKDDADSISADALKKQVEENKELSNKIISLTSSLLDSWKDLKEIYRIPKRRKLLEKVPQGGDNEQTTESQTSSPVSNMSGGRSKDDHDKSPPHRNRSRYDRERNREGYRTRDQDKDRRSHKSPIRSRGKEEDGGKFSKLSVQERDSGNKYSWLYEPSSRLSREEHRRQFEKDMKYRDEKKNEMKDLEKSNIWPQPATTSTASVFAPNLPPKSPRSDPATFTPSGYSGNLIQINPTPVPPRPMLYSASQPQQTPPFAVTQSLLKAPNPLQPHYISESSQQGQPISVIGVPQPQQGYASQPSLLGDPLALQPTLPSSYQLPPTVESEITVLGYQGDKVIVLLSMDQLKELTDLLSTKAAMQPSLVQPPNMQPQLQLQNQPLLHTPTPVVAPIHIPQQGSAQLPIQTSTLQPDSVSHLTQDSLQPKDPLLEEARIPEARSAFYPSPPYNDVTEPQLKTGGKSPPRDPRPPRLPPNWKTATDGDGCVYYYHVITRQTQWELPTWDGAEEDMVGKKGADMDISTPTSEDGSKKVVDKLAATAVIASGAEQARKARDTFRTLMSQHVVICLSSYRKPDCKVGRITSTDDFKKLARKLTHNILMKEIKQVQVWEDLECNSNVKHKAKEYVRKYMAKMGPVYKSKDDDNPK